MKRIVTEISNGVVIARNGEKHYILDPGVVVFEGNEIIFVGTAYNGLYCAGCCWVLMGLLFFGDVMYLYWIVGLTVIVLIKKVIPYGSRESYSLGAVLIVCGGVVLSGAFRLTVKSVLLSRIG